MRLGAFPIPNPPPIPLSRPVPSSSFPHLGPPFLLRRTISNITAGNKDQIQSIIDAGIIPPLIHLLGSAEFDIKKEAAWCEWAHSNRSPCPQAILSFLAPLLSL